MKVEYVVRAKTLNGLMVVHDTLISFMQSGLLGVKTAPTYIKSEIVNDNTEYPFLSKYEVDTDRLKIDTENFHPDITLPYFNKEGTIEYSYPHGDSPDDNAFDMMITVENNNDRDSIGEQLCEIYTGSPIFIDNDLMINYTGDDNKVYISFIPMTHTDVFIHRKWFR